MIEFLRKIVNFFDAFAPKKEPEKTSVATKKEVDPRIVIPIAVGATILVAGTAFVVFKYVTKKKQELEEKEAIEETEEDFFEGEDA